MIQIFINNFIFDQEKLFSVFYKFNHTHVYLIILNSMVFLFLLLLYVGKYAIYVMEMFGI
jgi:hypothetical protein